MPAARGYGACGLLRTSVRTREGQKSVKCALWIAPGQGRAALRRAGPSRAGLTHLAYRWQSLVAAAESSGSSGAVVPPPPPPSSSSSHQHLTDLSLDDFDKVIHTAIEEEVHHALEQELEHLNQVGAGAGN